MRKKYILFAILVLVLITLACNALSQQAEPASGDLPLTEAEVPRVTIEEARAALDNGTAVIVDVRSAAAYEQSHIAGAVSIPLDEIEANPAGLNLDKEQWIITYCAWPSEQTSARAAFLLLQNGYTRVNPILGGWDAWVAAGLPTEP